MAAVRVGERVSVEQGSCAGHHGTVRALCRFSSRDWVGVELDAPVGKHDGRAQSGEYHFRCAAGHGIYLRANVGYLKPLPVPHSPPADGPQARGQRAGRVGASTLWGSYGTHWRDPKLSPPGGSERRAELSSPGGSGQAEQPGAAGQSQRSPDRPFNARYVDFMRQEGRKERLEGLFRKLDWHKAGTVDEQLLTKLGCGHQTRWSEKDTARLLHAADRDEQGRLARDEFVYQFERALPQAETDFEAVIDDFMRSAEAYRAQRQSSPQADTNAAYSASKSPPVRRAAYSRSVDPHPFSAPTACQARPVTANASSRLKVEDLCSAGPELESRSDRLGSLFDLLDDNASGVLDDRALGMLKELCELHAPPGVAGGEGGVMELVQQMRAVPAGELDRERFMAQMGQGLPESRGAFDAVTRPMLRALESRLWRQQWGKLAMKRPRAKQDDVEQEAEAARVKAEAEVAKAKAEEEKAAKVKAAEEAAAKAKAEQEEEAARVKAATEAAEARVRAAEVVEEARARAAGEEKAAKVKAAEEAAAKAKAEQEEEAARVKAATEAAEARVRAAEEEEEAEARVRAAEEEEEAEARAKAEQEEKAVKVKAAEEAAAKAKAEQEEEAARVKAATEAAEARVRAAEEEEEAEARARAAEEEKAAKVKAAEEESARVKAATEAAEARVRAAEEEEEAEARAKAEQEEKAVKVKAAEEAAAKAKAEQEEESARVKAATEAAEARVRAAEVVEEARARAAEEEAAAKALVMTERDLEVEKAREAELWLAGDTLSPTTCRLQADQADARVNKLESDASSSLAFIVDVLDAMDAGAEVGVAKATADAAAKVVEAEARAEEYRAAAQASAEAAIVEAEERAFQVQEAAEQAIEAWSAANSKAEIATDKEAASADVEAARQEAEARVAEVQALEEALEEARQQLEAAWYSEHAKSEVEGVLADSQGGALPDKLPSPVTDPQDAVLLSNQVQMANSELPEDQAQLREGMRTMQESLEWLEAMLEERNERIKFLEAKSRSGEIETDARAKEHLQRLETTLTTIQRLETTLKTRDEQIEELKAEGDMTQADKTQDAIQQLQATLRLREEQIIVLKTEARVVQRRMNMAQAEQSQEDEGWLNQTELEHAAVTTVDPSTFHTSNLMLGHAIPLGTPGAVPQMKKRSPRNQTAQNAVSEPDALLADAVIAVPVEVVPALVKPSASPSNLIEALEYGVAWNDLGQLKAEAKTHRYNKSSWARALANEASKAKPMAENSSQDILFSQHRPMHKQAESEAKINQLVDELNVARDQAAKFEAEALAASNQHAKAMQSVHELEGELATSGTQWSETLEKSTKENSYLQEQVARLRNEVEQAEIESARLREQLAQGPDTSHEQSELLKGELEASQGMLEEQFAEIDGLRKAVQRLEGQANEAKATAAAMELKTTEDVAAARTEATKSAMVCDARATDAVAKAEAQLVVLQMELEGANREKAKVIEQKVERERELSQQISELETKISLHVKSAESSEAQAQAARAEAQANVVELETTLLNLTEEASLFKRRSVQTEASIADLEAALVKALGEATRRVSAAELKASDCIERIRTETEKEVASARVEDSLTIARSAEDQSSKDELNLMKTKNDELLALNAAQKLELLTLQQELQNAQAGEASLQEELMAKRDELDLINSEVEEREELISQKNSMLSEACDKLAMLQEASIADADLEAALVKALGEATRRVSAAELKASDCIERIRTEAEKEVASARVEDSLTIATSAEDQSSKDLVALKAECAAIQAEGKAELNLMKTKNDELLALNAAQKLELLTLQQELQNAQAGEASLQEELMAKRDELDLINSEVEEREELISQKNSMLSEACDELAMLQAQKQQLADVTKAAEALASSARFTSIRGEGDDAFVWETHERVTEAKCKLAEAKKGSEVPVVAAAAVDLASAQLNHYIAGSFTSVPPGGVYYQCVIERPGVSYRFTPRFEDKVAAWLLVGLTGLCDRTRMDAVRLRPMS